MKTDEKIITDKYDTDEVLEDGECRECGAPTGECWIGGNPDGSDATAFFPYAVRDGGPVCEECL